MESGANIPLDWSLMKAGAAKWIEPFLASMEEGVLLTDLDRRILYVNPAFTDVTGYRFSEIKGMTPAILKSGQTPPDTYRAMWEALHTAGTWQGRLWNKKKSGQLYPEWIHIFLLRGEDGEPQGYGGIFSDVSRAFDTERELEMLSNRDPLTGALNRAAFMFDYLHLVQQAREAGDGVGVLLLDIDHFKRVNESFGYGAGDEALRQVAARIRSRLSCAALLGRFGGDEFIIAERGVATVEQAQALAEGIEQALAVPLLLEGQSVYLTTSSGCALFPLHGEEAAPLIESGIQAMKFAKRSGRNQFIPYFHALKTDSSRHLQLERELREAIATRAFLLCYQPKFHAANNEIVGAEALVRWESDELGPVPTEEFVSFAEDNGLIVPLSEAVFELAAADWAALRAAGFKDIRLSLNLSAVHLEKENFLEHIDRLFGGSSCSPCDFEFELTERTVLSDEDVIAERLRALKARGFRLAVDDFGIGYSSLSYLNRFPFDAVKIDRSFVHNLHRNGDRLLVVDSIASLAEKLGMEVVAEGVETREELAALQRLGCHIIQGYYFSRPLPFYQFVEQLAYWKRKGID